MARSVYKGTVAQPTAYVEPERSEWCRLSLRSGWTHPDGSPGPGVETGDLVILFAATHPEVPVTAPPGWEAATAHTWYKVIGPGELDVLLRAPEPVRWAVQAQHYTGLDVPPFRAEEGSGE
jgi:hypothetical protein